MKKTTAKRLIFVLSLTLILMVIYMLIRPIWPPSIKTWGIMSLLLLVTGSIFLHGLVNIPANPPHKAVVTVLGKRTNNIKDEGWSFFLLRPYWYNYILVPVKKVNYDLPAQTVRTPDMAALEIPLSITWTPININTKIIDKKKVTVEGLLINYLDAGGENGVKKIIDDIARERLREWAMSEIEGPETWEDALNAREDAINVIMKSMVGDSLEPIHAPIPTAILLKFYYTLKDYAKDPSRLPKIEKLNEKNQKNWQQLKDYFDLLDLEEKNILFQEIQDRRTAITKMRQGNGNRVLEQLGIRLDRLNIDEMKPMGKLIDSAEKMVVEQRETKGDEIRVKNIKARLAELMVAPLSLTAEQALEVIQTERGKITKNISETKLNLSAETRGMIEKISSDVLTKVFAK